MQLNFKIQQRNRNLKTLPLLHCQLAGTVVSVTDGARNIGRDAHIETITAAPAVIAEVCTLHFFLE